MTFTGHGYATNTRATPDTATPPPFDFRRFVRAVVVFGLILLVLAVTTGNVH